MTRKETKPVSVTFWEVEYPIDVDPFTKTVRVFNEDEAKRVYAERFEQCRPTSRHVMRLYRFTRETLEEGGYQ